MARIRVAGIVAVAGWLAACAAPQLATRAAGTAAVAGTVRLVPHDGVPIHPQSNAYGDRRLRDVQLVDYSKPGSCVVNVDDEWGRKLVGELRANRQRVVTTSQQSDADLTTLIANGKGKMPAYGKSLKPDQVKDLVAYIRTLGKK